VTVLIADLANLYLLSRDAAAAKPLAACASSSTRHSS
jgi:hypothetical protein